MRTVGFLEKNHPRVLVAPRGKCPLEAIRCDVSAGISVTPALTSQESGFSPGKTCPWALPGWWDPPRNWATFAVLEVSWARQGCLSPSLGLALEML
ncbi:unnamed protein product [Prunus armeniaca]|nr:hypothetical protein GBA52_010450 [Prunus armeniaca]